MIAKLKLHVVALLLCSAALAVADASAQGTVWDKWENYKPDQNPPAAEPASSTAEGKPPAEEGQASKKSESSQPGAAKIGAQKKSVTARGAATQKVKGAKLVTKTATNKKSRSK